MIVSRLNLFLGTLFFMACLAALMNPPPYLVIATLFLIMGLVLLPPTSRLTKRRFNWEISGGTKAAVILIGFILVYLFVPQVEINPSPYSHSHNLKLESLNYRKADCKTTAFV